MFNFNRSQCFPVRVTGWPLELMAYAYLAVSPPSMRGQFEEVWLLHLLNFWMKNLWPSFNVVGDSLEQMAAAASNKTTVKKELRYPEIEEQALQFILDSCETSISKYKRFLQARNYIYIRSFYFSFLTIYIVLQDHSLSMLCQASSINIYNYHTKLSLLWILDFQF